MSLIDLVNQLVEEQSNEIEEVPMSVIEETVAECVAFEDKLSKLTDLQDIIRETEGINRRIAASFEQYGLTDFDFETYPVNSFSEIPSSQHQEISLEAIDRMKAALIAGGVAAVLLLLKKFVSWLLGRSSSSDDVVSNAGNAGKTADNLNDTSKEAKQQIKDIKKKERELEREARRVEAPPAEQQEMLDNSTQVLFLDKDGNVTETALEPVQAKAKKQFTAEELRDYYLANFIKNRLVMHVVGATYVRIAERLGNLQVGIIYGVATQDLDKKLEEVIVNAQAAMVGFGLMVNRSVELLTSTGELDAAQKTALKMMYMDEDAKNATVRLKEGLKHIQMEIEQIGFSEHGNEKNGFATICYDFLNRQPDQVNPTALAKEILVRLDTLANRPVSNLKRMELPDQTKSFKKAQELYEKFKDKKDLDTTRREALERLNSETREAVSNYSQALKILEYFARETKRFSDIIELFRPTYNQVIKDMVKMYFEQNNVDPSKHGKIVKEILKKLEI